MNYQIQPNPAGRQRQRIASRIVAIFALQLAGSSMGGNGGYDSLAGKPPESISPPRWLIQCNDQSHRFIEAKYSYLVDFDWTDTLRIVEDPDGHTNVREGQSTKAKIVDYVSSGSVVSVDPRSKGGWMRLISGRDMADDKFYIHSSRLREITDWTHNLIKSRDPQATSGSIKLADIEVFIEARPFDPTAHKVHKAPSETFLVDGVRSWGTDGGLPSSAFTLKVHFEGETIRIPDSVWGDLFEPHINTLAVMQSPKDKSHFLVLMSNSDAAGAYYVAWAFKGGHYKGRTVVEGYAMLTD